MGVSRSKSGTVYAKCTTLIESSPRRSRKGADVARFAVHLSRPAQSDAVPRHRHRPGGLSDKNDGSSYSCENMRGPRRCAAPLPSKSDTEGPVDPEWTPNGLWVGPSGCEFHGLRLRRDARCESGWRGMHRQGTGRESRKSWACICTADRGASCFRKEFPLVQQHWSRQ
jgi:hypothetical protein